MSPLKRRQKSVLLMPSVGERLGSWKEIAAYLNTSVRTVQRWEKTEGLPVRRHRHIVGGTIYAYRPELDAWWESRRMRLMEETMPAPPVEGGQAKHGSLRSLAWIAGLGRTGKRLLVILPLALLGAAGWRGTVGTRVALTMGAYVFAFSIAGRQDNYYWGLMYAPLMPLGLTFAPRALADLWKTAVGRQ